MIKEEQRIFLRSSISQREEGSRVDFFQRGKECGVREIGDINLEEMFKTLDEVKNGIFDSLDRTGVELLQNGEERIVKWIQIFLMCISITKEFPKTEEYITQYIFTKGMNVRESAQGSIKE